IPREIWARRLEERGLTGSVASHPYFTIAHILLPASERARHDEIKRRAIETIEAGGLEVILAERAPTRREALGPLGRANEPEFWQVAMLPRGAKRIENRDSYHIHTRLE